MKYLFIAALLVMSKLSQAQQAINGIGIIQLGKTEAQIRSDLNIDPKSTMDGSSVSLKTLVKRSKKEIVRIKYDPLGALVKDMMAEGIDIDKTFDKWGIQKCDDAFAYVIPKYEIAGVSVQQLKLVFYKDTLVKIFYFIEGEDLNKAFFTVFQSKYGDGKREEIKDIAKDYFKTSYSWQSATPGVNVEAYHLSSVVKNEDESTRTVIHFFMIDYPATVSTLDACNKNGSTNKANKDL